MSVNGTPPSPLRIARLEQGLRLTDVAERAGISVGYLSMIERGLECPGELRDRLAGALERDVACCFPGSP